MLAQNELGCFAPVRSVLPTVFDQARRMSVNLQSRIRIDTTWSNGEARELTLEQLSHLWSTPRFLPFFPLPIGIGVVLLSRESSSVAEGRDPLLKVPGKLLSPGTTTEVPCRSLEAAAKDLDTWLTEAGGGDEERDSDVNERAVAVCKSAGLDEQSHSQFCRS